MNGYLLKDHDVVLETLGSSINSSPKGGYGLKRYVLKVRDLEESERPREKLVKSGPSALSVSELLAVILGTGTKKEDVIQMAGRIVKEYGEQSIFDRVDANKVAEDLDIPLLKATQVVACAELGRRFFLKKSGSLAVIRTPQDVFEYCQSMRTLSKEHLRGIYLDSHYRVIHDEVISIGTINSSIIHPREVFKPAIQYGAVGVILAHNHPSGVLTPSQADIDITKQLSEAGEIIGISLIDHVILTEKEYQSVVSDNGEKE